MLIIMVIMGWLQRMERILHPKKEKTADQQSSYASRSKARQLLTFEFSLLS